MTMLRVAESTRSNAMSWMSAGFNIYGAYDLASSTLPRRIFDPRKAQTGADDTPFGRLPSFLSYRPIKASDFFYASGEGRESFQSSFASRASVDVSVGAFSGHVEAAYGREVSESSQYAFANVSYMEKLGNLVLEGLSESKYLTDEFTAALAALPDKVSSSNIEKFADFFQDFGAYFVSQITIGATLEYYVAVKRTDEAQSTSIKAKAEMEYKALFVSGKASAEMSSDQSWTRYRQNKTAVIKIRGGGDVERSVLSQVDAKSLDAMSQTTAQNYDKWLRSVATNPAVMDFRLTGIWEVCGAKRKTVEDAFREFGKMMRPLLRIETHCGPNPGPGYTPGVFLDGTLVPFDRSGAVEGWGGYRLIVIDRKQPSASGVRLSRVYTQSSGAPDKYREIFDRMLGDLRNGSFLQDGYFIVLSSFGMLNAFPPTPDMTRALQECGAGGQLGAWLGLAARGVGTANITHDISYMLVGITKSGPDAGVEVLAAFPMPPSGRIGHTSKLDVYFYSLGPRRPYVLGPAERRAMTA